MAETTKVDTDFLKQFEPDVFWQHHGRKIIWAVGILVVIGLVVVWRQRLTAQGEAEAAARLAVAADPVALDGIIKEYRGKEVAAQALLRLADLQFQAGNHAAAIEAYQSFLSTYPSHPLKESALLGIATAEEARGNFEAAKAQYQQIAASQSGGYSAIAARMGAARCAEALGQTREALQMYEELLPITQNSPRQMEAYLRLTVLSRSKEIAVTNQAGGQIESSQPLSLSPAPLQIPQK